MSSASVVPLRVAVVGCGAFGRNHLRVYQTLATSGVPVQVVALVDPNPGARELAVRDHGLPAFATVADLLAANLSLDAASVCTPTVHHADSAVALLEAGVDVLIEKPIAPSLADADRILAAAAGHARVVQVGHLERFNPAVTAALPLLHRPMFFEAHRLSVFTPRSLDVDVVLDLMIHDLDVVLALADSTVREVRAVGLPVLSREVDIANARVEFESGAVANFTASRVSTERVRKLRFFQPHQYLSLDFARQDLLMIDVTAAASLTPQQLEALLAGSGKSEVAAAEAKPDRPAGAEHPSAGLSLRKVPTEPGEPLRLEIEAFLSAVRTRETPRVSGAAARDALALALAIQDSIRDHRSRSGLV
ncbi:Gfo/Idh/MocA family protein [Terriglobus aquaticus]|uniref:Gfo/Idh/MocA family protein n=1 Tax=Terriglobus aquaticus TaxID=940139 RepID=A0ABW9KGY7_9BACT|nr:Gfo/Idh/MocA family oxidoreductase [Terriglobus aquaticus]